MPDHLEGRVKLMMPYDLLCILLYYKNRSFGLRNALKPKGSQPIS